MDSEKINDWMQVVGIFAVVASLIFVGMQMQQDQKIALSQAFQSRTDTQVEMLITSADNPLFVSAVTKNVSGNADSTTDMEGLAVRQYAAAFLYLSENLHYQYVNGFIDEDRWFGATIFPEGGGVTRSRLVCQTMVQIVRTTP